ncbi:MAG: NADPH-dependent F420 reductase [Pseudomonadota bacterium]
MKITIIGAGNVGRNLSNLFISGGHHVKVGLREGHQLPDEFTEGVQGAFVKDAIADADIVVLAIPYSACEKVLSELVDALSGKIVVDATNPLNDDWSPLVLGAQNSAGEENAKRLPNSHLVKAFNTVFADIMNADGLTHHGDSVTAFIAGDNEGARNQVAKLANTSGFAALEVGGMTNARYLEAMAHLNIQIAVGMDGGTHAGFIYFQQP